MLLKCTYKSQVLEHHAQIKQINQNRRINDDVTNSPLLKFRYLGTCNKYKI